jgi:hypothetical protein
MDIAEAMLWGPLRISDAASILKQGCNNGVA